MKNVAFLTTIFPMKEQFLIDFFDSLSRQTHDKFDVIVVNDGYDIFYDVKMKYQNLSIIELPYSDTPAKNREYGINYCIDNKYDILIVIFDLRLYSMLDLLMLYFHLFF